MTDGVSLTDSDIRTDSVLGKRIGGYVLGRTIGEGSFAKVKEGVHILTNQRVAIKVLDKTLMKGSEYLQRNFRREATLLQKLSHPNVSKLYEVLETENRYYLVMELAKGGELMNYICAKRKLTEGEARKFLRQIVSAVDYMHKAGVVHRDLKVENLLLDEQKNIKIIDFGLSNTMREGNFLMTQCGSPAYAAPELFCQKAYGPAVDVWSIGINMYAMLMGELPFHVEPINIAVLHAQILLGAEIPDGLTENCQDLLSQLLQQNEEKRIKMADVMKHPWINERYPNDPLEPAPFPAFKTPDQLNGHILTRMTESLGYVREDVVRFICENRASSATATYHLLEVMLNDIALRRQRSGGLRACFSDSQLDMQSENVSPQLNAKSLPTEPSRSFKEAATTLKQSELTQTRNQSSRRYSACVRIGRSSTDSEPKYDTNDQVERAVPGISRRRLSCNIDRSVPTGTPLLRRASTNTYTLGDELQKLRRKSGGLHLTVAYALKSNGMQSKQSGLGPRLGQNNKLGRSPTTVETRSPHRRLSLSDQTTPHSEAGTEIYRLSRDVFPPVIEEPLTLPKINGSCLVELTTSRTVRSLRSTVRKVTQQQ